MSVRITKFSIFQIVEVKRLKSDFLKGKEFCILCAKKPAQEELEKAVRKHGGTCVILPRSSTYMVVADRLSLRIKSILETRNVAKVRGSQLIQTLLRRLYSILSD